MEQDDSRNSSAPAILTLEVIREGAVVATFPVLHGTCHLGRATGNDLVLADNDVSKHHAVIESTADRVTVADLRSTNGTYVNDERVVAPRELSDGDLLRLGSTATVRVTVSSDDFVPPPVLHDLTSGLRYQFMTDRFTIGSAAESDLQLLDGPALAATLLLHSGAEVWLGTETTERPVALDEVFEVEGHRLKLEPSGPDSPTFAGAASTEYPYRLSASLNAPGGPVATLEDTLTGASHVITATNRAVLLFILGRKLLQDQEAGVPHHNAGWCDDDDVTTGVWGRNPPVGYNVLLHRIRKELKNAGFDPWFIEKRRGAVRARVAHVQLDT